MSRVRAGQITRARHKKIIKRAKGYSGRRKNTFKVANQAVEKAGQYAYIGRKQRKRQFRSLWITKINAAARLNNMSYSQLMNQLKKSDITINRKMLADLAVNNAENFAAIVNSIASQK